MRTFDEAEQKLAANLPGYTPRPKQQQAAHAIEEAIASQGSRIMVEAGTGVGKSFAGLIPAILSGQRVIFSTATKALQNQIVSSDLPFLQANLGVDFTWSLLKGRSNFVCLASMANSTEWEGHVAADQVQALQEAFGDDALEHVGDYESCNETLIEQGLPGLSEQQFSHLTVSGDDCPGKKMCPFGEICLSERAREKAQASQVVVANTALLLADAQIAERTAGNVTMLGNYDVQIIDEAHVVTEIATEAFAESVRERTVEALVNEINSFLGVFNDGRGIDRTTALQDANSRFWQIVPEVDTSVRWPNTDPIRLRRTWFSENFDQIMDLIDQVKDVCELVSGVKVPTSDMKNYAHKVKLLKRANNLVETFTTWCLAEDYDVARWVEFSKRTYGRRTTYFRAIKSAPVDVASALENLLWSRPDTTEKGSVTSVLMSATLSTGREGDFSFLQRSLGMQEASGLSVGTSFDYASQALTFLPSADSPSPKDPREWGPYLTFTIDRLVQESGGGALLLFTSRKSMESTFRQVSGQFEARGIRCYMQGHDGMSNLQISNAFRQDTNSVLFGLRSFFAGVDFSGETCRLVVMDKLTFPVPTEPVFQARSELCEARGGRAFSDLSIPVMSLTLIQGHGRLLRSKDDYGVVAILDSRLTSTGWGKKIARSLPSAPQTTDLNEVAQFYRSHR